VFINDVKLRLRLNQDDIFYYPDIMVTCDRRDDGPGDSIRVQHPTLIVEVLSPSTRNIDRREKLQNYRQIETLQEYVLIEQRRLEVTLYRRSASWTPVVVNARDGVAEFRSINLTLPLAQIYEGSLL
jgi:Uma2 family endonuclease